MFPSVPSLFILLGPPGSGKGTHALPLSQRLSLPHLSTGDLLRGHIREGSELGKQAEGLIQRGLLVPDELVLAMVADRISKSDCQRGYLLDGFPRTLPQALGFKELMAPGASLTVLYFDLPDSAVVERIGGRLACRGCTQNYHRTYAPPRREGRCDGCGSPLYQRGDDREEVVLERLAVYHRQTAPLVDFYREELVPIDASLSKEEVFEAILRALSRESSVR